MKYIHIHSEDIFKYLSETHNLNKNIHFLCVIPEGVKYIFCKQNLNSELQTTVSVLKGYELQCPTVNFSQILSQILVICPTAKFCANFLSKFLPIFTKSQITNHKICDRAPDRIFCDKSLFL